jgi:hypothetical protein
MIKWIYIVLFGGVPLLLGCSTFSREYESAVGRPVDPRSISGAWRGEWVSHGGHRGALRCILGETSVAQSGEQTYEAKFEAKFWGIFTAHYAVMLRGASHDGITTLSGNHDLGFMAGGVYHYEATVTPAEFKATYRSPADAGDFDMKRDPRGKSVLDLSPPNPEKRAEGPAAR